MPARLMVALQRRNFRGQPEELWARHGGSDSWSELCLQSIEPWTPASSTNEQQLLYFGATPGFNYKQLGPPAGGG